MCLFIQLGCLPSKIQYWHTIQSWLHINDHMNLIARLYKNGAKICVHIVKRFSTCLKKFKPFKISCDLVMHIVSHDMQTIKKTYIIILPTNAWAHAHNTLTKTTLTLLRSCTKCFRSDISDSVRNKSQIIK